MTNEQREAIKELLTFLADMKPETSTKNAMSAAETLKAALEDAKYYDKFPRTMKAPLTRVVDESDHTGATFLIMGAWVARLEERIKIQSDINVTLRKNLDQKRVSIAELTERLDTQNSINNSLNHRVSNLERE